MSMGFFAAGAMGQGGGGGGGLPQPSWSNVVSLLPFDGTDGSTTFTDEKRGTPWGSGAGVQIRTSASKFGGSSLWLPGNGNTLSHPDHSDFEFGSGDFTIEGWIRTNALTGANEYPGVFGKQSSDASQVSYLIYLNQNNGGIVFQYSVDGTNRQFAAKSGALMLGQFHHVAVSRVGNALRVFIDGVSGSAADMTGKTLFGGTSNVIFGRRGVGQSGNYYQGWIDDWRVCKQGLYAADFTPPSTPYPNS